MKPKTELEIALETLDELRTIIALRDDEIERLETQVEDLKEEMEKSSEDESERVGDALREALRPLAEQWADVQTPNGRYRWIERQVTLAGCE